MGLDEESAKSPRDKIIWHHLLREIKLHEFGHAKINNEDAASLARQLKKLDAESDRRLYTLTNLQYERFMKVHEARQQKYELKEADNTETRKWYIERKKTLDSIYQKDESWEEKNFYPQP